jgi:hypothetical protein
MSSNSDLDPKLLTIARKLLVVLYQPSPRSKLRSGERYRKASYCRVHTTRTYYQYIRRSSSKGFANSPPSYRMFRLSVCWGGRRSPALHILFVLDLMSFPLPPPPQHYRRPRTTMQKMRAIDCYLAFERAFGSIPATATKLVALCAFGPPHGRAIWHLSHVHVGHVQCADSWRSPR